MRSKVTFYVEATDPDHSTGVTEEDHNRLTDGIMSMGGEDFNIERDTGGSVERESDALRQPKPKEE